MTTNQIAFAKHREEARHNRVSERHEHVSVQAAKSQADTAAMRAREDSRHNRETERVNWWTAQEGQRHNVRTEDINMMTGQSQVRYQMAASEAQLRNAASQERQATVAERQAGVAEGSLAESIRHNQIYELETERHNRRAESLESARVAEMTRANKASESLGWGQLAETTRTHRANEAIQAHYNSGVLQNQATSNMLTQQANLERERANRYSEKQQNTAMRESRRHNYALEDLQRYSNTSNRISAVAKGIESGSSAARNIIGFIGGLL